MADYHIREVAENKKTINIVFHLPIPATNNIVGIAWRTALVNHQGGADAITSEILDIASEDLAALKAGSLYEKSITMRFSSIDLTNAERLAEVEDKYTEELAAVQANLQATLEYYGREGDVA